MKNLELKSKICLLFLLVGFYCYSQTCRITIDSLNTSRIDYINSDSVDLTGDFFVMLLCNSREGIFYYKIYKQNNNYYLKYGDIKYNAITEKIESDNKFEIVTTKIKGKYEIQSENFSREYFDMLIIKSTNTISQIIPCGSTIYQNKNCLINYDSSFYILLDELKKNMSQMAKKI